MLNQLLQRVWGQSAPATYRSKTTHTTDQWEQKIREKKAWGYTDQTFFESNPAILFTNKNLIIKPVSDSQILTLIKRMMGDHADKFDSAFSVRHPDADLAFDTYVRQQPTRKTQALWHSSHGENGLSNLHDALPVQAVREGYLTIYEVHVGEQPELVAYHPTQCAIRYIVKIKT